MPLLINNRRVNLGLLKSPTHVFAAFQNLTEASKSFLRQFVVKNLSASDRVLYVLQKEIATISSGLNKSELSYVASSDATTCHIVALIDKLSKGISLAHFDGGDMRNGFFKMVSQLNSISRTTDNGKRSYDFYVFGGFLDDRNISANLFMELLSVSDCVKEDLHLRLAVVHQINSIVVNNRYCPIIYGVGVKIDTCTIHVVSCQYHGPDLLLRHARLMYSNENSMIAIYDYMEGCIVLQPYSFKIPSTECLDLLLQLPDEEYLKITSTSPHCEPEHFVASSKRTLKFVLDHWREDFFHSNSRKFILDKDNNWKAVIPEHINTDPG